MTLAALNASDRTGFADALDGIFEGSRWVAERAWERRPFSCVEQLHASMSAEVANAESGQQLALLRAHPELGTRVRMTEPSEGEQARAGLSQMAPEEADRLGILNRAYHQKFGFPFLLAVRGLTSNDVMAALEQRLQAAPEDERAEALRQVYRIAGFRLHDRVRS